MCAPFVIVFATQSSMLSPLILGQSHESLKFSILPQTFTLYFPCLIPETVYFFKNSLFHINGLSVNYFLIVCLNNILIHFFSLGICFGFCNQFLLYARALSVHSVLNKTGVGLALGKYISCLPLCDKLPETSSLKLHLLITT